MGDSRRYSQEVKRYIWNHRWRIVPFGVDSFRVKSIATWIDEASAPFFKWVFSYHPELRIHDVRIEPNPPWEEVEGLLLTGGSDISEKFLRQSVPDSSLIKNPDLERDIWEFDVAQKALRQRMPILAICRGHQVLNVALGGTLHLDLPGHNEPRQKSNNIQELRFTEDASFKIPKVNSSHHQAIDKLGDGLKIEAWCKDDDVIEQVRLTDYPFAFAAQYHPERDPLYLPIFNAFAHQVLQVPLEHAPRSHRPDRLSSCLPNDTTDSDYFRLATAPGWEADCAAGKTLVHAVPSL